MIRPPTSRVVTPHDVPQTYCTVLSRPWNLTSKAFDVKFQGRDKTVQYVWGTSWGVTTRLVGGLIMVHGDDSGLVLPPKVAPYQVVILPLGRDNWRETVLPTALGIKQQLVDAGVRVTLDDRDRRPGWKFA